MVEGRLAILRFYLALVELTPSLFQSHAGTLQAIWLLAQSHPKMVQMPPHETLSLPYLLHFPLPGYAQEGG